MFCFCAWISSFFLSKVLRISRSPFLALSTRTCLGRLVCLFREGKSRIILMCMENATFLWCSVFQHHSPQSSNQYWWRQVAGNPWSRGQGRRRSMFCCGCVDKHGVNDLSCTSRRRDHCCYTHAADPEDEELFRLWKCCDKDVEMFINFFLKSQMVRESEAEKWADRHWLAWQCVCTWLSHDGRFLTKGTIEKFH